MRIHSHPALLTALVVLLTGSGAAGGAPAEEADPSSTPATSVAIPMGNAFADGFSGRIADENDKITFAPGDMTAPQQVADEGSGSFAYGYDFSPDGSVLYGVVDATSSLVTVDQATGAFTVVGPMGKAVTDRWVDLTIDPITGRAYAAAVPNSLTSYVLYSVDLATGATTTIASVPTSAIPIDMSMNCAGELYAETLGTAQLYRVNPATAQFSLVGPLGHYLENAQGMDFDNATGVLHAWLYDSATLDYSSIDTSTGHATSFPGTEPNGEFEGAIKSECPAPTASVTSGPGGRTADLRPTFGFQAAYAASTRCSVDHGVPAFVPCTAPSFQPAAPLTAGAWTFRVQAVRGSHVSEGVRSFQVVDCAALRKVVADAGKKVHAAKVKLKKAKRTGDKQKVRAATKKLKRAARALAAAQHALAAETVCG